MRRAGQALLVALPGLTGCASRPTDGGPGISLPGGRAHALRVMALEPLDSVSQPAGARELRLWPGGFGPARLLRVVESGDSGSIVEWWAAVPRATGGTRQERSEYQRALRAANTCVAERPAAEGTGCLLGRLEGDAARAVIHRVDSLRRSIPDLPDPAPGRIQIDGMSLRGEELRGPGYSSFSLGSRYFQPGSAARELFRLVATPER